MFTICEIPEYKDFYDVIYADFAGAVRCHKEVYKSKEVEVTSWNNGQREIIYSMPIAVPQTLTALIGGDQVPIIDTQNVTLKENGEFEVASTPLLQIPGGKNYTTSAKVIVKSNDAEGCKIVIWASCKAAGPWGLINFIEGVMAEQAKSKMEAFLEFCGKEIEQWHKQKPSQNVDDVQSTCSDEFFEIQGAMSEASTMEGSLYSAVSRVSEVGFVPSAAVTDNLQKVLQATGEIHKNVKELSAKFKELENVLHRQSRRSFWMSFALGTCYVALLWQAVKHRR